MAHVTDLHPSRGGEEHRGGYGLLCVALWETPGIVHVCRSSLKGASIIATKTLRVLLLVVDFLVEAWCRAEGLPRSTSGASSVVSATFKEVVASVEGPFLQALALPHLAPDAARDAEEDDGHAEE